MTGPRLPAAEIRHIDMLPGTDPPAWRCRLRVAGTDVIGHCIGPLPADGRAALRAFLRDARAYLDAPSFEYWAAATGRDPDSRTAETIYRRHGRVAQQLRHLLGPDFDAAIRNPDCGALT